MNNNSEEKLHELLPVRDMYQNWFLDYASYVILERAVPAIEDGLKPVQRRILHAMREMDDGRYNKVANIIGQTMMYHPHGDASIGDALTHLGQKVTALIQVDCVHNFHDNFHRLIGISTNLADDEFEAKSQRGQELLEACIRELLPDQVHNTHADGMLPPAMIDAIPATFTAIAVVIVLSFQIFIVCSEIFIFRLPVLHLDQPPVRLSLALVLAEPLHQLGLVSHFGAAAQAALVHVFLVGLASRDIGWIDTEMITLSIFLLD